ncbi:hypothetical protein N7535_004324 [Penicillium sp. DV-2018c]|nr:hypothetical protein N7461_007908 [Penicillium sp. DV-2018c]KAJ5570664.1 hypothetical protein N7535_004324 [Penicillium sp. DV-2018c]
MSRPTLILAPGAWYPPAAFEPLISILQDHTCHVIAFPSIQQSTTTKDLQPDIAAVRSLIELEADAGRDTVVISHSWSGLPVNSALDGLGKSDREQAGLKGGVSRLIFISAFLPNVGESLIGAFGGTSPDWYIRNEENGTVSAADPHGLFFHDVPDGAEWANTLRPHAWATKNSPATSMACLNIPSSYLLCEHDRAIPLPVQESMVQRMQQLGANMTTETIKTGHSPWLVVPDQVADFIRREIDRSM